MNFKSWPYSIKGGIVGLIVAIPISYVQGRKNCLFLSDVPHDLACSEFITALLSGVSIILVGVVIGSILGYFYGKFMSRKQIV